MVYRGEGQRERAAVPRDDTGPVRLQPDAAVLAQVAALVAQEGPLPFSRFMDVALYGPSGYYTRHARIGAAGDFVTAATAPGFAHAIGRWVERQWANMGRPPVFQIVEVGAGEGELAAALTHHLAAWCNGLGSEAPQLLYVILETSEALAARQRRRLAGAPLPVRWGDPDGGVDGVVIGNEVLDALPVERVRRTSRGAWEWAAVTVAMPASGEVYDAVTLGGDPGELTVTWQPAPHDLAALCDAWLPIPPGTEAELCPLYGEWFAAARRWGRRLRALWLDYGITTSEWAAGVRPQGTLRGYAGHRHVDPLLAAGVCDITADVHWDWACTAAEAAGWKVRDFQSQGSFLLRHGILEVMEAEGLSEAERLARAAAVKTLVLPGGMGERYSALELAADDAVT